MLIGFFIRAVSNLGLNRGQKSQPIGALKVLVTEKINLSPELNRFHGIFNVEIILNQFILSQRFKVHPNQAAHNEKER